MTLRKAHGQTALYILAEKLSRFLTNIMLLSKVLSHDPPYYTSTSNYSSWHSCPVNVKYFIYLLFFFVKARRSSGVTGASDTHSNGTKRGGGFLPTK